jgi:hypothetical protein
MNRTPGAVILRKITGIGADQEIGHKVIHYCDLKTAKLVNSLALKNTAVDLPAEPNMA